MDEQNIENLNSPNVDENGELITTDPEPTSEEGSALPQTEEAEELEKLKKQLRKKIKPKTN